MILGGPKDTITSLRTKGLKALVPPNSFGPPTMVGVVVDFKDWARRAPKLLVPDNSHTTNTSALRYHCSGNIVFSSRCTLFHIEHERDCKRTHQVLLKTKSIT